MFMTLTNDAKFEEKLTYGLENDMRNLANFYQSTRKSQIWDFNGILLSKVMIMKNGAKFEVELACRFKIGIRNLTNF